VNHPATRRRFFFDGSARDVYLARDGRQYIVDNHGLPVFGVWVRADMAEGNRSVILPRCPAR
jgi:hypothetical protein